MARNRRQGDVEGQTFLDGLDQEEGRLSFVDEGELEAVRQEKRSAMEEHNGRELELAGQVKEIIYQCQRVTAVLQEISDTLSDISHGIDSLSVDCETLRREGPTRVVPAVFFGASPVGRIARPGGNDRAPY